MGRIMDNITRTRIALGLERTDCSTCIHHIQGYPGYCMQDTIAREERTWIQWPCYRDSVPQWPKTGHNFPYWEPKP
jgi:hypothetical protein